MKQTNLFGKNFTTGKLGEYLAINKFNDLGFKFQCNVEKDNSHDFDFIVNGKRVEVKCANENYSKISPKYKYGRWTFDYTKEKGKFDVLICIGRTKNKTIFLVIPAEKIKGEKAIAIYPFSNTKNWKYYSQFINAWDYLK